MELDGARVLVCGGGRRLGRAIAEDLAAAGCSMAVSSRSAVAPVAVRETRTTIALRGDLGDAVQARAVVEDAATALGGLDGIVYAAGGAFTPMALADITPELVEDALNRGESATTVMCPKVLDVLEHEDSGTFGIDDLAESPE